MSVTRVLPPSVLNIIAAHIPNLVILRKLASAFNIEKG